MQHVHWHNDPFWKIVAYYLGPINDLFRDPDVTDILVNRFDAIYVDSNRDGMVKTDACFENEEQLRNLIEQIANVLNQPINVERFPILHARLPDGTRVCATLETVTPGGCTISFRRHASTSLSLADLCESGSLSAAMQDYLTRCVLDAHNLIVSGATASGKTTLLNALTALIPVDERVIRCEDTQELITNVPNTIGTEAPKRFFSSEDGGYNITLSTLIETALRQRPDRILVGEIRDAAAADAYLQAINTGHRGTCATLHANSAHRAVTRLQALAAGCGSIPYDVLKKEIFFNLDTIIQVERVRDVGRRVVEIISLDGNTIKTLFLYDRKTNEFVQH